MKNSTEIQSKDNAVWNTVNLKDGDIGSVDYVSYVNIRYCVNYVSIKYID